MHYFQNINSELINEFILIHRPWIFYYFYYNQEMHNYEGWNFNSGNYLFTTDTK